MKEEISWSSIVGFLLLLALGIGIPFWLEYKSLTNPPAPASGAAPRVRVPAIDARKGVHCGDCGQNLTLPEWSGDAERKNGLAAPLSLETLERPKWETLESSTRTAAGWLGRRHP